MTNTQQLLVELQEMFRNVEYQDGIGRCLTQDLEAVEVAYDKVRREINSTLGSGSGTGSRVGHTAGPWQVTRPQNTNALRQALKEEYSRLNYTLTNVLVESQEQADANARLIAAAPELLDALEAIRARIKGDYDNPALVKQGPLTAVYADVLAFASAAIAKAEGRD